MWAMVKLAIYEAFLFAAERSYLILNFYLLQTQIFEREISFHSVDNSGNKQLYLLQYGSMLSSE